MKYTLIVLMFFVWTIARAETYNVYSYISFCESGDNPEAINWKDAELRSDKQPSRGIYQFYWKTWVHYAKFYKVIPESANLTIKQVNEYLHDPVYNAAVAHGMIADGLTSHWGNCYQKFLNYTYALNLKGVKTSDG